MKHLQQKVVTAKTKFVFLNEEPDSLTAFPDVGEKVLAMYKRPLSAQTWRLNFSLTNGREDSLFVKAIDQERVKIGWGKEPKTKLHPSRSLDGTHSIFRLEEELTNMLNQASEEYKEAIVMGIEAQEKANNKLADLVTTPLSPEQQSAQAEAQRGYLAVSKAKRQTGGGIQGVIDNTQA